MDTHIRQTQVIDLFENWDYDPPPAPPPKNLPDTLQELSAASNTR